THKTIRFEIPTGTVSSVEGTCTLKKLHLPHGDNICEKDVFVDLVLCSTNTSSINARCLYFFSQIFVCTYLACVCLSILSTDHFAQRNCANGVKHCLAANIFELLHQFI